ncbi:MAG: GNAT family N-acetyltransferase [Elusimicrobia bacterium]|nr:GNAT family N-acetyltransferase [Elusimicrobiota bacterium]
MTTYKYEWLPGSLWESQELIEELSDFYSAHYGKWSAQSPVNPGQFIKLSAARIREWLSPPNVSIALAKLNGELVGYAIAVQTKVEDFGVVSWVTQLVVHEEHRHRGVGKELLFSIWSFTDNAAWGLITANPYAIRALEKATRRRCLPQRIAKNKRRLLKLGGDTVPYVKTAAEVEIGTAVSRINTKFHLDHSDISQMLAQATSLEAPWMLGSLDEGWEWLAFTFRDQGIFSLTAEEIEGMLRASDQITKQAYSRMLLDASHRWAQHTDKEARFVIEHCCIAPGQSVLDLGCGTGRHSIALSLSGFDVTGIDYLNEFISSAQKKAIEAGADKVRFMEADCRDVKLEHPFDSVICLYDVVGTYADDAENLKILKTVSRMLRPGGRALISVINFTLTERKAKHFFSLRDNPDRLLNLAPSRTMEGTGDIFNPEYYMIDKDTHVVYRKEQFAAGRSLPAELIVRDRRYTKQQIERHCTDVGLNVEWSRFVRAGQWEIALAEDNEHAKEILLLCSNPG